MNPLELIEKVKTKKSLTEDEIRSFVKAISDDKVPDYQTAAWLMAVRLMSSLSRKRTFMPPTGLEIAGLK